MQNPQGFGRESKERAFADMVAALADIVLNDPASPETLKLSLRLLNEAKDLQFKLNRTVMEVTAKLDPFAGSADVLRGKKLLEYLCLMQAGFDSFLQSIEEK